MTFKIEAFKLKRKQSFVQLVKSKGFPEKSAQQLFNMPYNSGLRKYKTHDKVPEGETIKLPNMRAAELQEIADGLQFFDSQVADALGFEKKLQTVYDLEDAVDDTIDKADRMERDLFASANANAKFALTCRKRFSGKSIGEVAECLAAIEKFAGVATDWQKDQVKAVDALRKSAKALKSKLATAKGIRDRTAKVITFVRTQSAKGRKEALRNLHLTL